MLKTEGELDQALDDAIKIAELDRNPPDIQKIIGEW